MTTFNESGSKYLRHVDTVADGCIDVYAVLQAFEVHCPARQHAIKKLLCAGLRDKGSRIQDLREARDAIDRALQMTPTPVREYVDELKDRMAKESSHTADELALDVSSDTARALHRIVRAMHDGHCPSCGCIADAEVFRLPSSPIQYQCPQCPFHVTCFEAGKALAEFLPFLRKSVEVFNQWRKNV